MAKVTLVNAQGGTAAEICHLTAVDGDTLTVIRWQEGAASRRWGLGDRVGNFATRGSENNVVQPEQLQGDDYIYSAALGTSNNLVVNLPSTYRKDNWDLKSPIVIRPKENNTGNVSIQLILGGMIIGTFPVYKGGKSQLVRDDITAGIPFIVMLDKTKTFFFYHRQ